PSTGAPGAWAVPGLWRQRAPRRRSRAALPPGVRATGLRRPHRAGDGHGWETVASWFSSLGGDNDGAVHERVDVADVGVRARRRERVRELVPVVQHARVDGPAGEVDGVRDVAVVGPTDRRAGLDGQLGRREPEVEDVDCCNGPSGRRGLCGGPSEAGEPEGSEDNCDGAGQGSDQQRGSPCSSTGGGRGGRGGHGVAPVRWHEIDLTTRYG